MIEKREFDVFIYLDRSRLGRISALSMAVVELCHEAGIVTYSTESPPNTLDAPAATFMDNLIGAVQSVTAQEEVNQIRRRHNMGMTDRVMRGDFPGIIPYGWQIIYEMDENDKPVKKIVVNEKVRPIIEEFVNLYYFGGKALGAIGKEFRRRGYPPPRGGNWDRGSMEALLNMIWRYAGYVELNQKSEHRTYVRAKSKWPAIISEELANAVVEERARRAVERRTVHSTHRFSGVVWCAYCGKKMKAHRGSVPNREKTKYYPREIFVCRNQDGDVKHLKATISNSILMPAVRDAFVWIKDERNREAILGEPESRIKQIQAAIDKLTMQLDDKERAMERAYDRYVDGDVPLLQFKAKSAKLREQRKKIEEELTRRQDELLAEQHHSKRGERLLEVAHMGLEMLEEPDLDLANAWLRRHIKITHNGFAVDDQPRIIIDWL